MVDLRFRAVLFDLFDTLLLLDDAEVFYPVCLERTFEFLLNRAINVSYEAFKKTYSTVRDEMVEKAWKTFEEPHFNLRVSRTVQRLGFNLGEKDPIVAGATKAFADEFKCHTHPDPEANNVLMRLHQKCRLGLVSNFGIPECGYELLDEFGLKQFLDAVVISGAVNRRKPSPEIFRLALKALDVEAADAVFVGGSLDLDIEGPKNVGMKAILIKRRPIPEDNKVKPDAIVERLSELPKLLAVLK